MDWLTMIPLIVGVFSNLSAIVLQSLAEWLITIVLPVFVVAGVCAFALAAVAGLWVKRAIRELHPSPAAVLR